MVDAEGLGREAMERELRPPIESEAQAGRGGWLGRNRRKRSCCGCLVMGLGLYVLLAMVESCTSGGSGSGGGAEESNLDRATRTAKDEIQNVPVQYD